MKGKGLRVLALVLAAATLVSSPMDVAAKKGKRYLKDVYTGDSCYKDVRYCNERYMFGDKLGKHDSLNPNKLIDKGKFIDYVYNMYGDPIEDAQRRGYLFYGDLYGGHFDNLDQLAYDSTGWYGTDVIYDRSGTKYTWDSNYQCYRDANGNVYRGDDYYYYNSRSNRRRNYGDEAWEWALVIGIVSLNEDPDDTAKCSWAYNVCDYLGYYLDGRGVTFHNRIARKMHKYDACRIMHLFCGNSRYDVDDIGYRVYYTRS